MKSAPGVWSALEERVRETKARAAIRSWEYRQRSHAKGVWFRLRRLLAEAESAWSISEEEARHLIEEGLMPEAVGQELEPPKVLIFVPRQKVADLSDRSPLPLRLGAELLAARFLALVPFDVLPVRESR